MQTESTQITYLNQEAAKKVDEELMQEYGWTMEALMELAGLSTAQAIHDCNSKYHNSSLKKVLVMIGPGNNGGDGYVTANHLKQFGYDPQLLVFRKPEKSLYVGLTKVCEGNNIKINYYDDESTPKEVSKLINDNFDLAVDAMFGFSFKGPLKAPYDKVLPDLKNVTKPIFSIDVPSGWADEGNSYNLFEPEYVISLTLPKLGMKHFKGKHYLGGRFVPAKMIEKNGWKFPNYHSSNQFVEL